jgi:hypothetical protein
MPIHGVLKTSESGGLVINFCVNRFMATNFPGRSDNCHGSTNAEQQHKSYKEKPLTTFKTPHALCRRVL